jgi:hypothetical protein
VKILILCLLLSACTLRVETRSEKEIEQDNKVQSNDKLMNYCKTRCEPFAVLGIVPLEYRCICGDKK